MCQDKGPGLASPLIGVDWLSQKDYFKFYNSINVHDAMLFKEVVEISQSLKQRFPGTDPCCTNADPQGLK